MLPPSSASKHTARTTLKNNNWTSAIAVSLVCVSVYYIGIFFFGVISEIIGTEDFTFFSLNYYENVYNIIVLAVTVLYNLFVVFPIMLGTRKYFWNMTSGTDESAVTAFYYFSSGKDYIKSIFVGLSLYWRIAAVFAVGFAPALILNLLTTPNTYDVFGTTMPVFFTYLPDVQYVLFDAGIVVGTLFFLRYFLALPIIFEYEDIKPNMAFRRSVVMTRGSRMALVNLAFSFVGWILLSLIVLPIPYTVPYMMSSYSVFCRYALNAHIRRKEALRIRDERFFSASQM